MDFFGSGTTSDAAKRLDRCFIGCDIDEHCVNEAKRRLFEEINNHGE
jgi:DNA modification methylase